MSKDIENKFIVINKKRLKDAPNEIHTFLSEVCEWLHEYEPSKNKYYVVNQDEPYANDVRDLILGNTRNTEPQQVEEKLRADIREALNEIDKQVKFWEVLMDEEQKTGWTVVGEKSIEFLSKIKSILQKGTPQQVNQVSEWVSVEDRLPEEGTKVILHFSNSAGKHVCSAWFDGDKFTDYEGRTYNIVHHWKLFPQPPTNTEEEG